MQTSIAVLVLAACAAGLSGCGSDSPREPAGAPLASGTTPTDRPGETFGSPDAAVAALAVALTNHDRQRAEGLFGPGSLEVLESGDPAADQQAAERIVEMIHEKVAFEGRGGQQVALVGNDAWPLAIPLVQAGDRWRFDLDAGREELLRRRIGRNELFTIEALQECVAAQHEQRDATPGAETRPFASRFTSPDAGQDGLYWKARAGQPESPVGPLLAAAAWEDPPAPGHEATPLHGYYYRMLHGQGTAAPGGKLEYLDEGGRMTRGCAVIAWPATYGNSGVMTFIVNHHGVVFEKDLGPDTATAAGAIKAYDPDGTWKPARP